MRLFIALDIDEPIRLQLQTFVQGVSTFAPDVRFVSPETFHVTLKFLGETNKTDEIKRVLKEVQAPPFPVEFKGYGFFPGAKNPRVFWVGIHAGPKLQQLATAVDLAMAPFGFEREKGPYHPHLTLARSGSGRPRSIPGDHPNSKFQRIQQRLVQHPQPEFGTMTAREFFLYESKLSPSGAQYYKVERYPLEVASQS